MNIIRARTTLTAAEEAAVAELRKTLLLLPDDPPVVVREFIRPDMSRSASDRRLRRSGISNLKKLIPKEENEENRPEKFKNYEPDFVHASMKYLPRMPDETDRKYLSVDIDEATPPSVYGAGLKDCGIRPRSFPGNLIEKAPFTISKALPDSRKEFTDRPFRAAGQAPSDKTAHGAVGPFSGRVAEIPDRTGLESSRNSGASSPNLQSPYSSEKLRTHHAGRGSEKTERNTSRPL